MLFQTERLSVRRFTLGDAPFVLRLLNEPLWHQHIGDRGLRTLEDAQTYLTTRLLAHYEAHGFGSYCVELRDTGEPMGLTGLIQREGLDAPDLGYAILGAHHGRGYATEAARATLTHARTDLGLDRVVAFIDADNVASRRVLEKVGMRPAGTYTAEGEHEPCLLYEI